MKVLLVCPIRLKTDQTGDATQARETERALLQAGHTVKRLYYFGSPLQFVDGAERMLDAKDLLKCIEQSDVVHHLPASKGLCMEWQKFPHRPTLGSSIFWGGWERVWIAWRTIPDKRKALRQALWEIHNMMPSRMEHAGIDVFLPNSTAEGDRVMRCFGHSKTATYRPVPNGFVAPAFDISSLPRSEKVPTADYIVVPGVFAYRKNQLGLIRAVKKLPYHIVFMGGVIHEDFYALCKKEATERMHFIGYVSSASEEYWRILSHARVACLASDCETPAIAMLEAAYAGARPVITKFGGTAEYYGDHAEYLNPCFEWSIRRAVQRGWKRGRLTREDAAKFKRFSWAYCAEKTIDAYAFAMERFSEQGDQKSCYKST